MLTSSVIIPTYNRPEDLQNCLQSLLEQTMLPDEIIIVDDGALETLPLKESFEEHGTAYLYFKKDTPGLTESRNAGIAMATKDIIFFLDDDVVLEKEYIQEILKAYHTGADSDETIGGVGGIITNKEPLGFLQKLRRYINILFGVSGTREGRVLPSGFCTDFGTTPFPLQGVTKVEFLDGGVCSYRKEVFNTHTFTDKYRKYGFGEDKDFSYRIAQEHTLLLTPFARLEHLESPVMRPDLRTWGRKFVMGRFLFFRDHLYTGWWSWLFFYWALVGYSLDRLIIAALKRKPGEVQRVLGVIDAAIIILQRGKAIDYS